MTEAASFLPRVSQRLVVGKVSRDADPLPGLKYTFLLSKKGLTMLVVGKMSPSRVLLNLFIRIKSLSERPVVVRTTLTEERFTSRSLVLAYCRQLKVVPIF